MTALRHPACGGTRLGPSYKVVEADEFFESIITVAPLPESSQAVNIGTDLNCLIHAPRGTIDLGSRIHYCPIPNGRRYGIEADNSGNRQSITAIILGL
jgi:hypothetical protein